MAATTPKTPSLAPQRWHGLGCWLGRLTLRLLGFRVEGELPALPRVLIVGAPHTSNWDFVLGAATMLALCLDISWLGKHTLFRWPFGPFMRFLGGVPVNRKKVEGVVEGAVAAFASRDKCWVAIAPEGTRKRVERWKTGFHRIAMGADVPIWPVAFDYSRRAVVLMPVYRLTGDLDADIVALQGLYRLEMARHREGFWKS